ncbi:MAG: site-2 protease family protein [Planctomycetes bacterium]|nr:site-2 protease family protein [Planctomycetota bacterium]
MVGGGGETNPLLVLGSLALFTVSQAIHNAIQAYVAGRLGDPTARDAGRASLKPWVHVDWFGTLVLPTILLSTTGITFGAGKRLPVDATRLGSPHRDVFFVWLAGPLASLLLALGGSLLALVASRVGVVDPGGAVYDLFLQWAWMNTLLFALHLVPLPPLDAARILAAFLRPKIRASYEGIGIFGLLFLASAFFTPLGEILDQKTESLPIWLDFAARLVIP